MVLKSPNIKTELNQSSGPRRLNIELAVYITFPYNYNNLGSNSNCCSFTSGILLTDIRLQLQSVVTVFCLSYSWCSLHFQQKTDVDCRKDSWANAPVSTKPHYWRTRTMRHDIVLSEKSANKNDISKRVTTNPIHSSEMVVPSHEHR